MLSLLIFLILPARPPRQLELAKMWAENWSMGGKVSNGLILISKHNVAGYDVHPRVHVFPFHSGLDAIELPRHCVVESTARAYKVALSCLNQEGDTLPHKQQPTGGHRLWPATCGRSQELDFCRHGSKPVDVMKLISTEKNDPRMVDVMDQDMKSYSHDSRLRA